MRYLLQEQKDETIYNISIKEFKKGNTFEDVFGNETNLDYMIPALKQKRSTLKKTLLKK